MEKSTDVAGHLMNGLIRLGARLPEENKDAVVNRLLGMDKLRSLVGETPVIHTVGAIGGDKAASLVTVFLDQTQDPSQKRWALSTLGAMGNDRAADSLLKYIQRPDSELEVLGFLV